MRKTKSTKPPVPPSKVKKLKAAQLTNDLNTFVNNTNDVLQGLIASEKVFIKFQGFILQMIENREALEGSPCFCKRVEIEAEKRVLELCMEKLKELQEEENINAAPI